MDTLKIPELYLLALALVFTVPYLIWRLGRTDGWAPLVVVQIVTGILLGPGVLGRAAPGYYSFIFKPDVVTMLNGVALWALILFVWGAGLELDLGQVWKHRRETFLTAGLALGMPLALGFFASLFLMGTGWIGPAAMPWQFSIGIGMACAVTALPILVLFLEKLDILRTSLGQRILRYASLDDIAVWAVMAAIVMDYSRLGQQAVFLILFALAAVVYRKVVPKLSPSDRWPVALIWLALVSFGADWGGLHFMVGAFLAGAVSDSEWYGQEHLDRFRNAVLLAFMPVFFLSTGLRTTWSVGGAAVFAAAGILFLAAVAGKLAGVAVAGRILRWPKGESLLIGLLLQTKALIMIIFANILLDKQIISSDTFTALVLMAVASTIIAMPWAKTVLNSARKPEGPMVQPE